MRITERLRGLKAWTVKNLCEGREMKAPAEGMDIGIINRQVPKCYLAWAPAKVNDMGVPMEIPESTVPSVLIMPNHSYAKFVEEGRFDRRLNIHRPQEMGQQLGVSFLFSVYEPGIRLPGFTDSVGERGEGLDSSLILEGTEEGLMTLMSWMDDCMELLLGTKIIPHADLFVREETVTYSLYTDQKYVVDRRPIYYGFVNCVFGGYATEADNPELRALL